jgi:hypothetical protein
MGANAAVAVAAVTQHYEDKLRGLQAEPEREALLDVLERECWDLRAVDVPTGGGDFDVAWVVIEHHWTKPREREVGRGSTPREAIKDALATPEADET